MGSNFRFLRFHPFFSVSCLPFFRQELSFLFSCRILYIRSAKPPSFRYVVALLALCTSPTSFGQLMGFFQYKNRNTFRENYLNPLKQLGFIVATKPDTPNAPDNKYVITEQGKAFLMGA